MSVFKLLKIALTFPVLALAILVFEVVVFLGYCLMGLYVVANCLIKASKKDGNNVAEVAEAFRPLIQLMTRTGNIIGVLYAGWKRAVR